MRVAYLGGGTGGHLSPGIGIAEALKCQSPRSERQQTLFLVAGRGVERAMLRPRQLPFVELFGDRGRPPPWRLDLWARGTSRLARALQRFDPEVLVVLGGWVALPALWLGALPGVRRWPTVLVEPNAVPGKVGRLLDGRVDFACLAREGAAMPRGRRATTVTGVPGPALRPWERGAAAAVFGLDARRRTLLVCGGSQGSRDINRLLPGLLPLLVGRSEPWQVLHISGPQGGCPSCLETTVHGDRPPATESVPLVTRGFLEDMSPAWALADLALCRAGSGTCWELQASATPAVLVPYPHHRDHHQAANAAGLVERGAALMVGRQDPSGALTVPGLLSRALGELATMSQAAWRRDRQEPARSVAQVVRRAAGHGRLAP